jgi:hypothetical protein
MFVRTLIGREAGGIIDLPYSAAQACLAVGSAMAVTDEEVLAAGLTPPPAAPVNAPEGLPRDYRVEPDPEGPGFNVVDPGGVMLNKQPLPNLAAARSLAHSHADPFAGQHDGAPAVDEAVDLSKLSRSDLNALAARRGVDITSAKNRNDVIALLEANAESDGDLSKLTKDELVALAGEHGVDISTAETKAEIIAAIQMADE